jgi:hypothetical protein
MADRHHLAMGRGVAFQLDGREEDWASLVLSVLREGFSGVSADAW